MHNCLICKNTLKNFVFKIKTCVAPMAIKLAPLKLMYCKSCGHLQKRIDDAWHNNIRFASLIDNPNSKVPMDYCNDEIDLDKEGIWVEFPWES
mgnify:CR=1 FL=1